MDYINDAENASLLSDDILDWKKGNLKLNWDVVWDGTPAIEFVSPILTSHDFRDLIHDLNKLQDKGVGPNYSAHVHIGLPKRFDEFNMASVYLLNNEDYIIKNQVGAGREDYLDVWANPVGPILKKHLSTLKLASSPERFVSRMGINRDALARAVSENPARYLQKRDKTTVV